MTPPEESPADAASVLEPRPILRRFSLASLLAATTLFALMFALLGGMLRHDATPYRPVYVLATLLAPTAAPVAVWLVRRIPRRKSS